MASWSSLDYYGRWKALHYAAKRFYEPVLLSVEDVETTMNVWVTSDVNAPFEGTLRWLLMTLDGETLKSGQADVKVGALGSEKIIGLDFKADVLGASDRRREIVFVAELFQGETRMASRMGLFAPNKHLELDEPGLEIEVVREGKLARFLVTAHSLARFVELKLEGSDAVFSDNYFDVPAGWTVAVTCPIPQGWSLQKVRKELMAHSLYHSY